MKALLSQLIWIATVSLARAWAYPTPGSVDQYYIRTDVPGLISQVAALPDGKVLVIATTLDFVVNGGHGESYRAIYRLDADGTLDRSFHSSSNYVPDSFALQTDGRLVVGGSLVQNETGRRAGVFRLLADGTMDSSFQPLQTEIDDYIHGGISVQIFGVHIDLEGNIVAVGSFLEFAGSPQPGCVRLKPNGIPDPDFRAPGRQGNNVSGVGFQSDGRAVMTMWELSGEFSPHPVLGSRSPRIVRLLKDGKIDPTFREPSPVRTLTLLTVQPDDRLICTEVSRGASKTLIRLNPDGSRDSTFKATVSAMADDDDITIATVPRVNVQPDGKLVVLGVFNRANGAIHRGLVRFHSSGSVDETFNAGQGITELSGALLQSLALQQDGSFVVGGSFFSEGEFQRVSITRFWGDPLLQIGALSRVGGNLEFSVLQPIDDVATLQASEDLSHWAAVASVTNATQNTPLSVPIDNKPWQFFRLTIE